MEDKFISLEILYVHYICFYKIFPLFLSTNLEIIQNTKIGYDILIKKLIPFALPDINDDEIKEVVACLKSGWLTTGCRTKGFEDHFSEYLKVRNALAVNSGTAGLHLALEACGIAPGDEVVTTPYTFTATAEVVRYLGADPLFVDIDSDTFNIDPGKIESTITPRTKAILPVHFAGQACDMEAILAISKEYGLKIIEDAAHALPSTYQ